MVDKLLDKMGLIDLVPGLSIRPRELPDSVACVIACGPGDPLLALVDENKPLCWQHLAQLLTETALISLPVNLLGSGLLT